MKKEDFLKRYNIDIQEFKNTGFQWDELLKIKADYEMNIQSLKQVAKDISERLLDLTKKVHSVKYRVKDSEHLIEKIIRKKIKDKNRNITLDNYSQEISDLVGVRVLHLFKEDWLEIHKHIVGVWTLNEGIIAYYRSGDNQSNLKIYQDNNCNITQHELGYRSIHYIIKTMPTKKIQLVEIQVRTLFEEAWSEIDHLIRYPYNVNDALLNPYLDLFNRLAGSADEMGSFVKILQANIGNFKNEIGEQAKKYDSRIADLEKKIKALQIAPEEKSKMEADIFGIRSDNLFGTAIDSDLAKNLFGFQYADPFKSNPKLDNSVYYDMFKSPALEAALAAALPKKNKK